MAVNEFLRGLKYKICEETETTVEYTNIKNDILLNILFMDCEPIIESITIEGYFNEEPIHEYDCYEVKTFEFKDYNIDGTLFLSLYALG